MDRQVWHMTYLFWRFEKLWFLALSISKFGNGFIYRQLWIKAVKLLWKHIDGPLKESCEMVKHYVWLLIKGTELYAKG